MKHFTLIKTTLMLCLMMVGLSAWGDSYTTSSWPTTGWSQKGGSQTVNGVSWTYSEGTYFGVSSNKLQIGSKNNPQSSKWTISTPVSSFGDGAKVTAVTINAYTTATTATYDISVNGSSAKSGSLTTSATDYSATGLNVTGGNIVVTMTGSSTSKAIYLASITVTYETGSTGPVDASWSVSPSEIAVKTGKNASATVTTNYDGELVAETNDAKVATCSYEDGVLTVTGVSAGTTTITFLGDETSKYNEIEKEVTVTVTDPVVFDPSNFVIADFEEDIPAAVDGNINFKLGEYAFAIKKNTGSTAPTVGTNKNADNEKDIRIYAKGTITISSTTKKFDGVVFNISTQGLTRLAPITADCGTVATQTSGDNTVTWSSTTPVSSVTFTVGDKADYGSDGSSKAGQLDFKSMSINEVAVPTKATITLNSKCTDGEYVYGTYSNSSAFVANGDIIVYEVFVQNDEVSLWKYETNAVVPANTGVLVCALKGGDYEVELTSEKGESVLKTSNCLRATGNGITAEQMAAADEGKEYFRLTMHGKQCGFWWGAENGASFALGANKAYLVADPASGGAKGFSFNWGQDTEDAIKAVKADSNKVIYNLSGQRIQKMQKGINIVNGKKILK